MHHFYQDSEWLYGLAPEVQARVLNGMKSCHLSRGDYLFRCGEEVIGVYRVLEGYIAMIHRDENGNEIIIGIHGPGSCLGEMPVVFDGQRGLDALAMGDARVGMLSKAEFNHLLSDHPEIYRLLMKKLNNTMNRLLLYIGDSALLTLGQRLAKLLLSASQTYASQSSAGVVIDVPLSQSDLGNMLGVTRNSIQRELKGWQDAGVLFKVKGRWVIQDMDALEHFAKP